MVGVNGLTGGLAGCLAVVVVVGRRDGGGGRRFDELAFAVEGGYKGARVGLEEFVEKGIFFLFTLRVGYLCYHALRGGSSWSVVFSSISISGLSAEVSLASLSVWYGDAQCVLGSL